MKRISKYNQHILDLSATLPPITEKQKQWAMRHFFDGKKGKGFFSRKNVWCLNCGKVFSYDIPALGIDLKVGNNTVCPECGCKLEVENNREKKHREAWYFTILTTCKGFQVCRHFVIEKIIYRIDKNIHGCSEPHFSINEAVQNWIDENGKETIIARPTKPINYVYDAWNFDKPMGIHTADKCRNSYSPNKYDIGADIYPIRRILPKLKKYGYTGRFQRISASELFKLLLKDNEAEMLIKTGQYDLLTYKYKRGWGVLPNDHTIRIANRNKYIVKDASMWFDYLALLSYFHLDTHNAHYVCPADLKAEHDKLLKRKERIEARLELKKKLEESKQWEKSYRESKGRFFGICFGNENIVITVIQSVAEMAEEGKAMHHCVYSMGYYKNPNSLILSAKDMNGKRIETIEIDLKTFSVLQSRGVNNSNTDRHDEIIQLVRDNMNLIMKAA